MPSVAGARKPSALKRGGKPASRPGGELALIELVRSRAQADFRAAGAQGGAPRQSSPGLTRGGLTRGGLGRSALRLGIGDDCAILRPPPGHDLLVTTDFSLEGRHFRRDWHAPAAIGHRALARGLSDLAAMGAAPLAAFLSLALPRSLARDRRWINGFLDGLLGLARIHGVPLAGGDTSESPASGTGTGAGTGSVNPAWAGGRREGRTVKEVDAPVLADIVLLGSALAGRALRRSGARPGDRLYCTGALGGAAAELAKLAASPRSFRAARAGGQHPHLFPQPRLGVGRALLRRNLASACIDLSDGLSTDLAHLCHQSSQAAKFGIAAEVDAAALPLHPLAAALGAAPALQAALHGGEDYELLFTAVAGTRMPRSLDGVPITAIGRIVRRPRGAAQVTLLHGFSENQTGRRTGTGRGEALRPGGWEHLR